MANCNPLRSRRSGRGNEQSQRGFTYLGVLFAIVIMGMALATTGQFWSTAQKREKERELLFIGNEFRNAIALYYERSPGPAKQFPKTLQELLKDPRKLTTERYLRKIYRDPMTNKTEWGLVKGPDDRIEGVHSLAQSQPFKTGNFSHADREFEGKLTYSDWKFVYQPKPVPLPAQPGQGLPAAKSGAGVGPSGSPQSR
jgi:type II secretory pathway pseudopilin PulG